MPVTKSALRAVKNITRGASDAEALLRATTSNDALPPTGRQLHEIARASYDAADLPSILEILDKRLNDKGKYWRHVYKSLIVLDYLLHTGSPSVASYFRQNIYLIKTLAEFQHVDDTGRDVGKDVRVRARDVARLLQNPSLLDDARRNRRAMYDRMAGRDSSESAARKDEKPPTLPPRPKSQEDREAAELAKVLKLSEQEEAARRAALAKANEGDLFDEMANELIDLSETPSLQPQPTVMPGYLQPQYTSMQPQYTSLQPQFTSLQPQYTSLQPQYSPFQPQYTGVQQQYTGLQPQYTAAYDPYNQQAQYEALLQQQQQQQWEQPKPLEPQLTVNIGSNNPFGPRALSAPVYDPNTNPFARASTPSGSSASSLSPPRTPPSAYTDHGHARTSSADDYRGADRFNVDYRSASAPSGIDWEKRGKMSALERAIAARDDGQDTFGNVGSLRYGSTTHGRLAAQRTGAYVQ